MSLALSNWQLICSPTCLLSFIRQHAGLSLTQQRTLLGLHHSSNDALWTRLQAMPLPRPDHFDADLQRIVAHVLRSSPHGTIHTSQLAALLRTPLEP